MDFELTKSNIDIIDLNCKITRLKEKDYSKLEKLMIHFVENKVSKIIKKK